MYRLLCLAALFAWVAVPADASDHSDGEQIQRETPYLTALLTYDHHVLIIANDDVAAVIRLEETAPFTVEYRYRLLRFESGEETGGKGTLFDQPKSKKPASIWLEAGPIRHQWSYSAPGRGWIYYLPEEVRFYLAKRERFSDLRLNRFSTRSRLPED